MENIIEVRNLCKQFNLEAGFFAKNRQNVYAVNDLTFNLARGETYGIVGESGCGKSTTAKMLIQLYRQTSGSILYLPENSSSPVEVSSLKKKPLARYREEVKYVFQDPARSLNPRMSVLDVLTAGLRYSSLWEGKKAALEEAEKIIKEAGLSSDDLFRRPAEFSGGQRQRISIARALIMNPRLILCDEVVSALDVSIQGQIINLLSDLKASRGLTYVFITHDLKVACYFCDRIGVMFRGVMVEEAAAEGLYKNAFHPYTKLLFSGAKGQLTSSSKEVKTTLERENCCPFAYRCPFASDRCKKELPGLRTLEDGHRVRCFLD